MPEPKQSVTQTPKNRIEETWEGKAFVGDPMPDGAHYAVIPLLFKRARLVRYDPGETEVYSDFW